MSRRTSIVAVVLASLVAAGAAGAKTVAVSITKNGYVPSSATIDVGDTVQLTNADSVVHQVVFKSTSGVTCTPATLVIQPGQSGSCTFATAGTYSYNDANVKGNTYRGSVTVVGAASESLTLAVTPPTLVFGAKVTLTGVLSTHAVGANVDVLEQPCGQTATTKAATVPTTAGGAYTAVVQPLVNTTYTVKSKNGTSGAVSVKTKPQLLLTRVAPHRFSVRALAGQSLAGKFVAFQRYSAALSRWVTVKQVLLRASSTGVAPTVVSSAAFRSTLRTGLRVRVLVTQAQVGTCYLPGTSNVVRS